MDVAEVEESASLRTRHDLWRDRQLNQVVLRAPFLLRDEELRLDVDMRFSRRCLAVSISGRQGPRTSYPGTKSVMSVPVLLASPTDWKVPVQPSSILYCTSGTPSASLSQPAAQGALGVSPRRSAAQ